MNLPSKRSGLLKRAQFFLLVTSFILLPQWLAADDRADIVVNDFESDTFGEWTSTGDAFGSGPVAGTLPHQQTVLGYEGERLANSYHNTDSGTGTLTSPAFEIERPYLNFLIGGGQHPGKCELQLLIGDEIVARATGHDDEELLWRSFDLADHQGETARIRIIDQETGQWGHINVDQIVLSETARQAAPVSRAFEVTHRYLHLPVSESGETRRMKLFVGDKLVRQFDIALSVSPDFWVFSDISQWKGQELTVQPGGKTNPAIHLIEQSDELPGADRMYSETDRPQFHFTSRRGWLNDPNGLVHYEGEWHLFYQHNPYGWEWGNMHWGHAVSPDLFHWKELDKAFHPFGEEAMGGAFSGSATIDHANTSGWQTGDEKVMVAAFTDTDSGEVIAYSNDRGRSFTMFDGNPVVRHQGRDPKLLWHEPTRKWIMAVYQELDDKQWIAFHSSPDLKDWMFESRIDGFFECPDLFQLPIDGDPTNTKWVLHGADMHYMLGDFDGHQFTPEHEGKYQVWHGNYYAAQSFDNAPENRRVQIGWARSITFPGMPFNQQMAVPVELTLRSTDDGARLFVEPVKELVDLRSQTHRLKNIIVSPGDPNPLDEVRAELVELDATFTPADDGRVIFNIRGAIVTYDAATQILECADQRVKLAPVDGEIRLQILVDRGSVECFGNSGRVAISGVARPAADSHYVHVRTEGAPTTFTQLTVHELESTWNP